MRTTSSEHFMKASMNKNVEWLNNPLSLLFYVLAVLISGLIISISTQFDLATAITVTNGVHTLISFIFFHWIKGSVDTYNQVCANTQEPLSFFLSFSYYFFFNRLIL